MRAQAAGNDSEAQQADAVAEVLAEHDAAHEPDARDQRTFDGDCPEQHADTLRDRPRRTGVWGRASLSGMATVASPT